MDINAEFLANPYPVYKSFRNEKPIFRDEEFLGGAWVFSLYDDVGTLLKDPRFSVERSDFYISQYGEENKKNLSCIGYTFSKWLLLTDPPKHTRVRKLMNPGFKPKMLESLRPNIYKIANELLDKAIAKNEGKFDFIADFANQYPVYVVAEMLGVPNEDKDRLVKWSDDIGAFFGSPSASYEIALAAEKSAQEVGEYFVDVIAERRKKRGKDLISLLVSVEEDGDALTGQELLAQCSMLIFGGHETTRNALGNVLYELLKRPDQKEILTANYALCKNAFKEIMRYNSSVQFSGRVALENIEHKGYQIKKGDLCVLLMGSANRDAAVFEDPEQFNIAIERTSKHLGLGLGPHACIGSVLAEMEVSIALEQVFKRFPKISFNKDELVWRPVFGFRGIQVFPVSIN